MMREVTRQVTERIMLELSKEKGDGKKNWSSLGKFLGQKKVEEVESEGSDDEKNGSKLNRDKEDQESMDEGQIASRNRAAA